jgi:prepilin-type N-terminal cleavage/methylation domain-containing protein
MNKKSSAFTLIELLVVIVILGILSTISVGTFRSYFAKARDAERVSAVQNLAMMIKVDSGGKGDCTVYNYTDDESCPDASMESLAKLALANDYRMPEVRNGLNYYYVFLPGATEGDNNFFVAVGAEEDNAANGVTVVSPFSIFVDGTLIGTEKARNCEWTDGNLVSCPPTDGRSWQVLALSASGGGGEAPCDNISNCAGCLTFASCQTPCGQSWSGGFTCIQN